MALIKEITDDGIGNLSPGVFFKEITPPGDRSIRTGIPVIVGFAAKPGDAAGGAYKLVSGKDPAASLQRFESWEDAKNRMGQVNREGYLDYAVRGFFENGGKTCIVVSLRDSADQSKAEALKRVFQDDGLLERMPEVLEADLVIVPDIMGKDILRSPGAVLELQEAVLGHCRRMGDRFAILDCGSSGEPALLNSKEASAQRQTSIRNAMNWQAGFTNMADLKGGAAYFPWIRVGHRNGDTATSVPPCGHVAGIYARSDGRYGVHKAPANEALEGVVDLEVRLKDEEQAELNKIGINCLRSFPGRGIRVWGARTLSSETHWRYVNVRRLFLALFRWCESNFDDLVFEANGPRLWEQVSSRLATYCHALFQQGALKGNSIHEAFYIKCDGETNPPEVRENGMMICEVGLAPSTPAEFVVVRLTCSVAGIGATT